MSDSDAVGIVGLGYVGLPLAVAFGARRFTIGFDLNADKLAAYASGRDPNGEVTDEQLAAAEHLEFTADPERLSEASVIIVVVPTPIDRAKRPDLSPLKKASEMIAPYLKYGSVVVYESTVFPGCVEDVCVPILEANSGLRWAGRPSENPEESEESDKGIAEGFFVGYSPERINPGDQMHRLESITKVVAADTYKTLNQIADLYESVISAGIHRAASIKVAEAAKVIENTQRDLNIALMNELAMIFERLNIDTLDVLAAAGTKWNFLPFKPGLVGGTVLALIRIT